MIMYFEIAAFIPITLLVIIQMVLFSIKVVGPLPQLPDKKHQISQAIGMNFFSLLTGFWILFIQIISLISLAAKPQYTPTYFIDSNRVFFTISIIIVCLWMISESFLVPSIWHILIFTATLGCLSIFWLGLLLFTNIDAETFLFNSLYILILIGCVFWFIFMLGIKKLERKHKGWLQPFYIAPKRYARLQQSPKVAFILLIILGILFMLSWADIPLF